jgi:hypothetical protein
LFCVYFKISLIRHISGVHFLPSRGGEEVGWWKKENYDQNFNFTHNVEKKTYLKNTVLLFKVKNSIIQLEEFTAHLAFVQVL